MSIFKIILEEQMAFTALQIGIFRFVKTSSNPILSDLCTEVGVEESVVRPVVEDLAKKGFLRIDDGGKKGREDRVKPHPDRPNLLWQFDFEKE